MNRHVFVSELAEFASNVLEAFKKANIPDGVVFLFRKGLSTPRGHIVPREEGRTALIQTLESKTLWMDPEERETKKLMVEQLKDPPPEGCIWVYASLRSGVGLVSMRKALVEAADAMSPPCDCPACRPTIRKDLN